MSPHCCTNNFPYFVATELKVTIFINLYQSFVFSCGEIIFDIRTLISSVSVRSRTNPVYHVFMFITRITRFQFLQSNSKISPQRKISSAPCSNARFYQAISKVMKRYIIRNFNEEVSFSSQVFHHIHNMKTKQRTVVHSKIMQGHIERTATDSTISRSHYDNRQ